MPYTKVDRINDLVIALNKKKNKENKPEVTRYWTGAGHWLKTNEEQYNSVGRIFVNDSEFIGFLEGLLCDD